MSSIKCESGSIHFQPGEGPSRGLLRDYTVITNLRMELFEALETTAQPSPAPADTRVKKSLCAKCGVDIFGMLQYLHFVWAENIAVLMCSLL